MTSNNRPLDPSDHGGASLRLPPLKLQTSPRQQSAPQASARRNGSTPATPQPARQPGKTPPSSGGTARVQPPAQKRENMPASQKQHNAPSASPQQSRMQPTDQPQMPQNPVQRPCCGNCPKQHAPHIDRGDVALRQTGIVQPPVVSGQEPPCKSPVSTEIVQRARALFPEDSPAAKPVYAQAQRSMPQSPRPAIPQQRYPLPQAPGPVVPQSRRPLPQSTNPFPRIFPGARFSQRRTANGMTMLEGTAQNNGAPIRIFAVPGAWAALPPAHLSGFNRYIRTPNGGYWVMVQGLR